MCERIVDELITDADDEILKMLEVIKTFINCYEDIIECIRRKGNIDEIIHAIDVVSTVMLLLQPSISNMRAN